MTRIIWSNRNLDIEDWRDAYKEFIEMNELDWDLDDEDRLYNFMYDTNNMYLDDERMNLDIPTEGRILVLADLGFWNGRKQGYKILAGNVRNIFSTGEDYNEWYSDGHNIKGIAAHHDGTHFMEYRVIREDRNIDNLLDAMYNGETITRKKLNYYTKSLHSYVAKAYGWQ